MFTFLRAPFVTRMRICLVGCGHGKLDDFYTRALLNDPPPDLILVAGDFQAIRDQKDLESMAVPLKYREMGDFESYYKGEKSAPILTIVIGGNHESSRFMEEMPNGGWLARNIYYLGRVGVVDVGGLTIGGISGVYAPEHFELPHFEKYPFDKSTIKSVYHVRREDTEKILKMKEGEVDIMMSHDWPAGIEQFGNVRHLLGVKRFLQDAVDKGTLGSPPAMQALRILKPKIWHSAHMHIKYNAEYPHDTHNTSFYALDKVLPRRKFCQFIEIESPKGKSMKITINKQWKAIQKGE